MITRRDLLIGSIAAGGASLLPVRSAVGTNEGKGIRLIPSTKEAIPAVGLGSWITFNVGKDPVARQNCADVMEAFFDAGGAMIDSSPMYGSSQSVIGAGLEKLNRPGRLFSADKVWTSSTQEGPQQIEVSRTRWDVERFDLLQVHNLVGWEAHLDLLSRMKADGNLRYLGVTTSHGRRHELLEEVMRMHDIDFVQLTYNPLDREVEQRLLPLARERGIAVIVNRPFQRGRLTERLEQEPLPDWASEIGAVTWAQIILKFILSHPAVTVAIPATTKPHHARENVEASHGTMPTPDMRERIAERIRDL